MHIFPSNFFILISYIGFNLIFTTAVLPQNKDDTATRFKRCWTYPTAEMSKTTIASDNESAIYLPKSDGTIESVNIFDGARIWMTEIGGEFTSNIFAGNKTLVATVRNRREQDTLLSRQNDDSFIYIVQRDNGLVLDKIKIDDNKEHYLLKSTGNFFLFSRDGILRSFDADWNQIWRNDVSIEISAAPKFFTDTDSSELIVFGTGNKSIVFISPSTGKIIKQIDTPEVPELITFGNEKIYITDQKGRIISMNHRNRLVDWSVSAGGRITDIKIYKNNLLVVSDDNFVYMLAAKNGNKLWKVNLGGRIAGSVFLDDKTVLILPHSSDTAYILDLKDGKIISRIYAGKDLYFVSPPVNTGGFFVLPTQKGLYTYSPGCKKA